MWDTHFYTNRDDNLGSGIFSSHLEQTGHTEATAVRNNVRPREKAKNLNIYLNALTELENEDTVHCTPNSKHPKSKKQPGLNRTPNVEQSANAKQSTPGVTPGTAPGKHPNPGNQPKTTPIIRQKRPGSKRFRPKD